jgi:hypothetical protein
LLKKQRRDRDRDREKDSRVCNAWKPQKQNWMT